MILHLSCEITPLENAYEGARFPQLLKLLLFFDKTPSRGQRAGAAI